MNLDQYLDVFIEESVEHLQFCHQQLLLLERQPNNRKWVDGIFRAVHTLKGMSATMGFDDIAQLSHEMENILDGIRHKRLPVTPALLDSIFQAVDALESMLGFIEKGGGSLIDISDPVRKLQAFIIGQEKESHFETAQTLNDLNTVLIDDTSNKELFTEGSRKQPFDVYKLDISLREDCQMKAARVLLIFQLLRSFGEIMKSIPVAEDLEKEQFQYMFTVIFATKEDQQQVYEEVMNMPEVDQVLITPISLEERSWRGSADADALQAINKPSGKSIRVNSEKLNQLLIKFEEWTLRHRMLEQLALETGNPALVEAVSGMVDVTADLQGMILQMRRVPAENIFNRFPGMVRRLSRELNKEIRLELQGAAIELDRTVVNEVGDCVLHFLRNAIDHGIETPEIRRWKGKSSEGTISIRAFSCENFVLIEMEDDGAGIDEEAVAKKAVDLGIVTQSQVETYSVQEKFELIFVSGFSTAPQISAISGRGVGLDAVKSMIESLGGEVMVQSRHGFGSKFTIKLPLA